MEEEENDGREDGWEICLAACFSQMTPISGQQSETVANAHSNNAFVTNPGLWEE